jgi:hypothetical protein
MTSSRKNSRVKSKAAGRVISNIELYFSGLGLVLIATGFLMARALTSQPCQVAALLGTLLGLVHGGLGWFIRRRQRLARERLLREAEALQEKGILARLDRVHISLRSRIGSSGLLAPELAEVQAIRAIAEEVLRRLQVIALEPVRLVQPDLLEPAQNGGQRTR